MMAIRLPQAPGEKEAMLAWAQERLPVDFGPPALAYTIGVCRDQQLAAVAVYNDFRKTDMRMSIAADTPRWATKEAIAFLLWWPFGMHPSLRRITAVVQKRNARSRKLVEGIGFRPEGTHLDLFEDDDGVSYALTRRWWSRSKWFLPDPQPNREAA